MPVVRDLYSKLYNQYFRSAKPIPPGSYAFKTPPGAELPYRLHLRIEPDGSGLLIVNASTVLHLNRTATEYAFHLIHETPRAEVGHLVAKRYRTKDNQAQQDYDQFSAQIHNLILNPDLDPSAYLNIERRTPYSKTHSAPYRLDCALTYRLPQGSEVQFAPVKRVERELETQEWIDIINKAWQAGIPHLIFTGGEPTLRPDLPDLLAAAEVNGQVTGLLTDALRLADREYFETLARSGLDHIMVVLHPDLEQSWEALKIILPDEIFAAVHLTITPENKTQIPDLIQKLKEMGASALSLSALDISLKAELKKAQEQAAGLHLPLVWDLPVPYSDFNPVGLEVQENLLTEGESGRAWLYVEPDGDVLPQQGVNQVLGNFLSDPWEKIWKYGL
ncbi:MAG: radical SAM protein [Chloroflexota bacterium]|jgi:hypothetical protein